MAEQEEEASDKRQLSGEEAMDESEEEPKSKEGEAKRRSKKSNSSVAKYVIKSSLQCSKGWVSTIYKR